MQTDREQHRLPLLKTSWGGGGRGMRVLENEADLIALVDVARREAQAAFGNDEVYLEKLVRNAAMWRCKSSATWRVMWCTCSSAIAACSGATKSGGASASALFGCSHRQHLCDCALRLARQVGYSCAGTVEFLDADTSQAYFIEVNPRIQVEHTVTEEVTGWI